MVACVASDQIERFVDGHAAGEGHDTFTMRVAARTPFVTLEVETDGGVLRSVPVVITDPADARPAEYLLFSSTTNTTGAALVVSTISPRLSARKRITAALAKASAISPSRESSEVVDIRHLPRRRFSYERVSDPADELPSAHSRESEISPHEPGQNVLDALDGLLIDHQLNILP